MDWSDEMAAKARLLWDEGWSTAEIGRRIGVSKNAVVGKARRLDFPPRPSPIHRSGEPRPPRPRRVGKVSLPALASTIVAERPAPVLKIAPKPLPPPQPVIPKPRIPCCWPIGEPKTDSFRFCEVPSVGGKPYCAEHMRVAYVPVRDRRDDASWAG